MTQQQTVNPADIRDFIVETFLFGDASNLQDDTSFMDTGLIDSMGILRVVDFIERTYSVKFGDGQLLPENLDSIANITRFVERSIREKNAEPCAALS